MCHAISARWPADNCPAISAAMLTSAFVGSTAPGLSVMMLVASAQSRSLTGSGASTLVMVVCTSGCIVASSPQRYQRSGGAGVVRIEVRGQPADPVLKLANSLLKLAVALRQLTGLGADFLGERLDEVQRLAPRDVDQIYLRQLFCNRLDGLVEEPIVAGRRRTVVRSDFRHRIEPRL